MLRYAIALVALLTFFSSCSTDFDLTGAYKEVPLVYGLLDPDESIQYFRIQKAFLGKESAFVMALEADSSYFKYSDLFVELVEYSGNSISNRWHLDTVMISNKDVGDPSDEAVDFFGPSQRLYSTSKVLDASGTTTVNILADRQYEIRLKKRPNGMTGDMKITNMDTVTPIADSRTSIINDASFKWNNPNENAPATPGATRKLDLFNTSGEYKDYAVRFELAQRAVQYEFWIRFHYREVIQGVSTNKSVEWRVTTFEPDPSASTWQLQATASSIYSKISTVIDVNPDAVRYIGLPDGAVGDPFPGDNHTHDFDFFFRMGGDELFQYIDINNPSNTGVLTDKPVYTNINNGLGVFSTRTKVEFEGLYLSETAADYLVSGEQTRDLGFIND